MWEWGIIGTKHIKTMKELIFYSRKRVMAITFFASFFGIGTALFWENYMGLEPCMLCYLQRGAIYFIVGLSFLGLLHREMSLKAFRTYLSVTLLSIVIGASLSIRQLYLQSLPDHLVPSCAPDINYLLDTLPIFEVLIMAIQGDGNCAEILWQFLGISIPGWLLIAFIFAAIYVLFSLYFSNDIRSHEDT